LVTSTLKNDEGLAFHFFLLLHYKGHILEEQTLRIRKLSKRDRNLIILDRLPLCGDPEAKI
jgi:hypothetical protein